MKINCASFSKYKLSLNCYSFKKLDFFSFLFTRILLDDSLDKSLKIIDCLNDLDIKEDLHYIFNNVYYNLVDNFIIKDNNYDDINDLKISDIEIDSRFTSYLKEGFLPVFNEEITKEFVYDHLLNKVVLMDKEISSDNICVVEVDNSITNIEKIVNDNKESLFDLSDGICIVKDVIVDPYYFDLNLDDEDKMVLHKSFKNKVYDSLLKNCLFVNDDILKGNFLSNNVYYKCLFAKEELKEYCDYLFVFNKEKEFDVMDNIIYVDYNFEFDYVDLVNKLGYKCGKCLLENDEYISTFKSSKADKTSEFKLYLLKNKNKFSKNIDKIIELI